MMLEIQSALFKATSVQRGAFLVVNKQVVPLYKNLTTLGRNLENDIVLH
jgi:hypothetical protein